MTTFIYFFIPLFAAHVFVDFLLQTKDDVERKSEPLILMRHAAGHGVLAYALLGAWAAWYVPAVIIISHGAIDWIKSRYDPRAPIPFAVDQATHLVVIVGLAVVLSRTDMLSQWAIWMGPAYFQVLAIISGGVLMFRAGSIVVEMGLRPFLREMERVSRQTSIREGERTATEARGFADGGRIIGYLERVLIFLFVVVGTPAGVGFLVAAKSIFRFGELKDARNRMEAEYIIIGTLMSFAYGLVVSYLIVVLMRAV